MSKILDAINKYLINLIFGPDTSNVNGDITYPGHINFANKGGEYFHGSKAKKFFTLRGLNSWCMPGNEGANTLIAEVIPTLLGYVVVYNRKLSARDMDTVDRYGREINAKIAEENRKFAAEDEERQAKKVAEEIEAKRLAEVGRKYEARVAKIRGLPASERKAAEKQLNNGDLDNK